MTVVSYVLVIILFITPRTFYIGGPGGGGNFLGRHGMITGSYSGSSSIVGVGGRPWLQKVAALAVAISLTIATVDSFRVAERQYEQGYTDATAMTQEVIDGTEIRIVRVISSTFLWLAQVQTLIRLFPRHKEKVMIKWAGFALIVLDTTFAILDNFVAHGSNTHPRLFDDAIPALAYLFELALNLLYAAWVIFYALSKHRFAFFHPKMRNICLVALLSLIAIFIPAVFFVMDISSPDVAGWGEYIRWVGSAAASVVVWEWVERIEALERDERKDGILGREVFDGDEMLEVTPSEEVDLPSPRGHDGGRGSGAVSSAWGGVMGLSHRPLRRNLGFQRGNRARHDPPRPRDQDRNKHFQPTQSGADLPIPPPAAVTPISRADTTSAASTVYYVHYHPVSSPTPPVPTALVPHEAEHEEGDKEMPTVFEDQSSINEAVNRPGNQNSNGTVPLRQESRWLSIASLFSRKRTSPPQEVATAQEQEHGLEQEQEQEQDRDQSSAGDPESLDEKGQPLSNARLRLAPFLSLNPRIWRQGSDGHEPKSLSVTVIPPRDRAQQTWSPPLQEAPRPHAGASNRQTSSNQSALPVTVISTQTRRSPPWPSLGGTGAGHGQIQPLRYDPETAALVGIGSGDDERVSEIDCDARDGSTRVASSGNDTLVGQNEEHVHRADGEPDQRRSFPSDTGASATSSSSSHFQSRQTSQLSHDDRDLEAGLGSASHRRR
jgi:hypothetical protein